MVACVNRRLTPGSWEVPQVEAGVRQAGIPPGLEGGVLSLGSETPGDSPVLVTDTGPHPAPDTSLVRRLAAAVWLAGAVPCPWTGPPSASASEARRLGPNTLPTRCGPVAEQDTELSVGQVWGMFVPQLTLPTPTNAVHACPLRCMSPVGSSREGESWWVSLSPRASQSRLQPVLAPGEVPVTWTACSL